MPSARYLLQFDLLGLEDVQHPAALDLREILPEVELGVGVAEQADLGQSLPLWQAGGLLFFFFFLWSLLAGWGTVGISLYFCILLPPGFNFLKGRFISVFLIQEPWNQTELE